MLIKLVQVSAPSTSGGEYELTQIYVNPSQIVFLSENKRMKTKLQEGRIKTKSGDQLNPLVTFTDIKLNENSQMIPEITVIGSPSEIENKINNGNKKILFG